MNIFEILASQLPDSLDAIYEVGCDHALITKAALTKGKARKVYVSDISEECLKKARITLAGRDASYFVFDGINPDIKADAIIICGMGGKLISKMISAYNGDAKLLLSPQKNPESVRLALETNGYKITKDFCFESSRKFYDCILAERGHMKLGVMERKFGAFYRTRSEALKKKLEKMLTNVKKGPDKEKSAELEEALSWQK